MSIITECSLVIFITADPQAFPNSIGNGVVRSYARPCVQLERAKIVGFYSAGFLLGTVPSCGERASRVEKDPSGQFSIGFHERQTDRRASLKPLSYPADWINIWTMCVRVITTCLTIYTFLR